MYLHHNAKGMGGLNQVLLTLMSRDVFDAVTFEIPAPERAPLGADMKLHHCHGGLLDCGTQTFVL